MIETKLEQFVAFLVPILSTTRLFALQTVSSVSFNHFAAFAFMRVAKGCAKTESTGYVY